MVLPSVTGMHLFGIVLSPFALLFSVPPPPFLHFRFLLRRRPSVGADPAIPGPCLLRGGRSSQLISVGRPVELAATGRSVSHISHASRIGVRCGASRGSDECCSIQFLCVWRRLGGRCCLPVPLRPGTHGMDCKWIPAACPWLALSLVLQTTNQLRHPFAMLRFKSRTFCRDTCLGTTARLRLILGLYPRQRGYADARCELRCGCSAGTSRLCLPVSGV